MSTTVQVEKFPKCDFCGEHAKYDFSMRAGRWAFGCEQHWRAYGFGVLGTGLGQQLILKNVGERENGSEP